MSDENTMTLAGLGAEIDRAWEELWAYLSERTPQELTELRDAEGWTAKDHLTHLVAWEQSVIAMFEGEPRYLGLGVDQALYEAGEFDPINAVIQQQRKEVPLDQALEQLRSTHAALMNHVGSISETDLNRPAGEVFPSVVAGERRSTGRIVFDNTAEHYAEHLEWIQTLVGGGP